MINVKKNIIPYIFTFFILCDNPFASLLPIPFYPFFILICILIILNRFLILWRKSSFIIILASFYSLTGAITSIVNHATAPIIFSLMICITFMSVFCLTKQEIDKIISCITSILSFYLLISVITVISNFIVRMTFFYIKEREFSILSFITDNYPFVRPAGFFYEPGQFSFYLCACAFCGYILNIKIKRQNLLMIIGIITQSISHYIFLSLYFIVQGKRFFRYNKIAFLINFLFISIVIFIYYYFGLLDWSLNRGVDFYNNPELWTRYNSYVNAIDLLNFDYNKFIFGPGYEYASRTYDPLDLNIGENFISPIIHGGLLAAWPYYMLLFFSSYQVLRLKNNSLLLFGISLLTLQRPYTLEFPYTIIIAICLYCYFTKSSKLNHTI